MPVSLHVIAETGERFTSFAPYVPAVNDAGTVAFQASIVGGGSGVFTSVGGSICGDAQVCSHPAINNAGVLSFYGESRSGKQGIFVSDPAFRSALPDNDAFTSIGPLGPTMNDAGTIAFRAQRSPDVHGIHTVGSNGETTHIADTEGAIAGFEGLPVVTNQGRVVFRATMADSAERIYAWKAGALTVVAETGSQFDALGRFPMANDQGTVVFAAKLENGASAVCTVRDGDCVIVADSSAGFESFRGALIDNHSTLIVFATPRGGELGIYQRADPAAGRVFGIGDALLGSVVTAFALNPVSINDEQQLAVRVELASGAEAVVLISL